MGGFVKDLRSILFNDNRSLKWWFDKHVRPKLPNLKYSNFIRKMNIPEEMTPELRAVIEHYLNSIDGV